jgi:hypothetical protein
MNPQTKPKDAGKTTSIVSRKSQECIFQAVRFVPQKHVFENLHVHLTNSKSINNTASYCIDLEHFQFELMQFFGSDEDEAKDYQVRF